MSAGRAALVVGLIALVSAALLALASRTPASVRHAKPDERASDPSLEARFSDAQVARHAAYQGPGYLALALGVVVELAVLVVLMRGPWARMVDMVASTPGGLVAHAALLGAVVVLITTAAALPLSYVRSFSIQHAWGLSTQDLSGWLLDKLRSTMVAVVMAGIASVVFFAVVRWQPRFWWLIGWAAFSWLSVILVFLYPVMIAPLFNSFTPLENDQLAGRIKELAREAGVEVGEVLVADASRRTTAENAYVAGLGRTKQVVLYDTLLQSADEKETLFVAAHELGHEVEDHVEKGLMMTSAGLLLGFAGLMWLASRDSVWAWASASGISDLRAMPVLLLFAVIANIAFLPVNSAVSRHFESRADAIAVELSGDPRTAVKSFRRLAFSNIADLDPPEALVAMLYTHPPITERIQAALVTGSR